MLFPRRDDGSGPEQEPEHEYERPERTGPARFWELIKDDLATVLIVNLLFLVTCIPIVTIPLAVFALHSVLRKIVREEAVSPAQTYFAAFRHSWKQSYLAFLLTALPMGLSGFGAVFYLQRSSQLPLLLLPCAMCITVFLVVMLSSTCLYGLLCDGTPLRQALRPAVMLGVGRPLRSLLASVCYYGLPLLAILFLPLSAAYLLLLGFSLPWFLGSFLIRTVLNLYSGT